MISAHVLLFISLLFSCVGAADVSSGEVKSNVGPLGYAPNTAAAIIFGVAFAIPAIHATWLMLRGGGRYMATLVISGYTYAIGLALRIPVGNNPTSKGLFIIMNLCTVLSPCGFIATVYVLLSQLAFHLHAEKLLIIGPNILTKVFVTSDVVTLIIQAGGASLAISQDENIRDLSKKIFLAGLILQVISFGVYLIVLGVFISRVKKQQSVQWSGSTESKSQPWRRLVTALIISCVGITVRCIYRTIEGGQGHSGYLATHEVYFYVLDCLPLLCAIAVYNVVWPPVVLVEYNNSHGLELLDKSRAGNV
ncbi:hypothetical protein FRC08_004611 [Ceratobasidium sp. 394]|nr:hypothetical protein FRC08_004611 [Ceratobasidium sp. 394]KAG9098235.1 hypothetical protein FS749_004307 [Ceratobasidium sp. UAMH 11750]